jgi:predicted nucleic acid-binding protein
MAAYAGEEAQRSGVFHGVHDLLTAALAAAHNLTVVHYDSDFETTATVLAFEQRWVLPRGVLSLLRPEKVGRG